MSKDEMGFRYFMIHIAVWVIALACNAFAFVLGVVFGNIELAVLNLSIVCLSIFMLCFWCSRWLGDNDTVGGDV